MRYSNYHKLNAILTAIQMCGRDKIRVYANYLFLLDAACLVSILCFTHNFEK